MSNTFFRWSAWCVLAGAVLLGTGYLLRINIDKKLIDGFATPQGLISSITVATGSLLLLFGLPALFAIQNLFASKSGIIASALGFIGIASFHLGTVALYFVAPVLVTHSVATRTLLYSDEPPFPLFAMFWASGLLIQVTGLFWVGIKTWSNSVRQKLSSLMLITGALLFLLAPFIYFPLIKPANSFVMLGFAFSAIAVLKSKAEILPELKASSAI